MRIFKKKTQQNSEGKEQKKKKIHVTLSLVVQDSFPP